MGIALLGLAGLFSPLHTAAHRWVRVRRIRPSAPHDGTVRPDSVVRPPCFSTGTVKNRPAQPLRVVRLIDAQDRHGGSGRIVISGRLQDVRVELERLAALEGDGPHTIAAPPP